MLQVGEDLEYVAEQMGNETSITTLKHYAQFIQQTGARHGSKLEEAYQKQIGNEVHNRIPSARILPDYKLKTL
jgi:hypothetical protein